MLLHPGTQERWISEAPTAAGTTSREGSTQTDSVLVSLWVESVTSGDLIVTLYTLTDTGREVAVFSFPTIAAPTAQLLLKQTGTILQRFRIEATYTGACNYEVYVRSVEGSGNVKLLGADNWRATQADVTAVAAVLIPAALTDRAGVVIKNWSASGTVYIGESLAKADSSVGWPLAPKDGLALDLAAGAAVYAVSDSGTIDVRILEAGG